MRQNCNKTAEKVLNYKDLTTEIQSMWNVKTKVIGIRIGGNWNHLRITQKISDQHIWEARHQELQKTAILGIAHTSRSINVKVFIMGNSITCTTYCNLRIAATLYDLETWYFPSIYLQIPRIKDDHDDDDDNNNRCPQGTIHETCNSEDLSMYANQIHLHSTICSSYFTFRDVCKIILKTDYMPRNVCTQSVSHWKYFREILCWGLLLKSVHQIRFYSKSDTIRYKVVQI